MPQAAIAPIIMGVMSAASIGAGALQAKSAEKAQEKAQKKAQAFAREQEETAQARWKENAFPASSAVNAAATENRGALGQARLSSYQNLASNLAARGFGSGSGLMAQGAADIEGGYLQALGRQGTQSTQFAQTPMFGPPTGYAPVNTMPVSGGTAAGLGKASDLMDTALGFYMAKQLGGDNQDLTYNYDPNAIAKGQYYYGG